MSTATFKEFVLPPREAVGYLDPEIAGEGVRVVGEDGETFNWTPPPDKLVMPDMSVIKTLKKYFNKTNHPAFPAWFYHPTLPDKLVRNSRDAHEMGIQWRATSPEESMRYGKKHVWDWRDDCHWRPQPYPERIKFDPNKLGQGKELIVKAVDNLTAQNLLVKQLIPEVAAAVAAALNRDGPSAPAHIDAREWEDFQAFRAFKKTREVVTELAASAVEPDAPEAEAAEDDDEDNALGASLTPDQERAIWVATAEERKIPIDKRWALARIREAVKGALSAPGPTE